jgi:hypothetical protein
MVQRHWVEPRRLVLRRRVKHTLSFEERLTKEADRWRAEADKLPPGIERDALLQKARKADNAARINAWVNSSGLKPPT